MWRCDQRHLAAHQIVGVRAAPMPVPEQNRAVQTRTVKLVAVYVGYKVQRDLWIALLKLGQALGTLGQTPDACVTLAEVGRRFPGSVHATNAQVSMQGLGCQ